MFVENKKIIKMNFYVLFYVVVLYKFLQGINQTI